LVAKIDGKAIGFSYATIGEYFIEIIHKIHYVYKYLGSFASITFSGSISEDKQTFIIEVTSSG
jgi:hypothetical protein